MPSAQPMIHSVESANLADLLERILDKGVVIAGDISIKLVDVELLTIQLRLVICSVDKARELGLDWWRQTGRTARPEPERDATIEAMGERLGRLEQALGAAAAAPVKEESAPGDAPVQLRSADRETPIKRRSVDRHAPFNLRIATHE